MNVETSVLDRPFIEDPPFIVADKFYGVRAEGEVLHIQVATDMSDEQVYGERWLLATDKQVCIIPVDGIDGIKQIALDQVQGAEVRELVGGGYLEVSC